MGFKDKMTKYYSDAYMNKYGDRMTSVSGTVLSVKTETKSFLGIFNRLHVWLVVKSDAGKQIAKCEYKRNRWFKKPEFIDINQGLWNNNSAILFENWGKEKTEGCN